jgi:gluconolactonase
LFSDIPARRIMKWEDGQLSAFRTDSNRANGLTFDHLGRLLACEAGRVTRTDHDGRITVLADRFQGKRLNIPNDLVYAIDGSI